MQVTFAYIHCEKRVTSGLAYHQTSHKRQVRMSVLLGSPHDFWRHASQREEFLGALEQGKITG